MFPTRSVKNIKRKDVRFILSENRLLVGKFRFHLILNELGTAWPPHRGVGGERRGWVDHSCGGKLLLTREHKINQPSRPVCTLHYILHLLLSIHYDSKWVPFTTRLALRMDRYYFCTVLFKHYEGDYSTVLVLCSTEFFQVLFIMPLRFRNPF